MAIDFPASPNINDTHTDAGRTWIWDGTSWIVTTNASNYVLPIATAGALGGIKVGTGLSIDGAGVLSSSSSLQSVTNNGAQTTNAITVGGNGTTGGVTVSDGNIGIRTGTGNVASIDLFCEVNNAHKVTIKAPPHANYSGNVDFTLPPNEGSVDQVLRTDGAGNTSWVNQTGGSGGSGTARGVYVPEVDKTATSSTAVYTNNDTTTTFPANGSTNMWKDVKFKELEHDKVYEFRYQGQSTGTGAYWGWFISDNNAVGIDGTNAQASAGQISEHLYSSYGTSDRWICYNADHDNSGDNGSVQGDANTSLSFYSGYNGIHWANPQNDFDVITDWHFVIDMPRRKVWVKQYTPSETSFKRAEIWKSAASQMSDAGECDPTDPTSSCTFSLRDPYADSGGSLGTNKYYFNFSCFIEMGGTGTVTVSEIPEKFSAFRDIGGGAGGSGTPGGSDTQVQFNDSGSFEGDASLTWDNTNNRLHIGADGTDSYLEVGSSNKRFQIRNNDTSSYLYSYAPNTFHIALASPSPAAGASIQLDWISGTMAHFKRNAECALYYANVQRFRTEDGAVKIIGGLLDKDDELGNAGQVLSSTGGATPELNWIDLPGSSTPSNTWVTYLNGQPRWSEQTAANSYNEVVTYQTASNTGPGGVDLTPLCDGNDGTYVNMGSGHADMSILWLSQAQLTDVIKITVGYDGHGWFGYNGVGQDSANALRVDNGQAYGANGVTGSPTEIILYDSSSPAYSGQLTYLNFIEYPDVNGSGGSNRGPGSRCHVYYFKITRSVDNVLTEITYTPSGGGAAQVNADWNATSGVAQILNKPTIPGNTTYDLTASNGSVATEEKILLTGSDSSEDAVTLAVSGNLTIARSNNTITFGGGGSAQIQSDWTQSNSSHTAFIQNKPSLATVATTGSYTDLSNQPSIPSAQVNSDWNAGTGTVAEILNKPTIPAAQVQSDWSATSGMGEILNKPTIPTNNSQLTNGAGYTTNTGTVTSVGLLGGTGVTVTNSPVTSSGNIDIELDANLNDINDVNVGTAQSRTANTYLRWTGAEFDLASGSSYTLPTATTNDLGGVKIDGSTITINNGVISAGSGTASVPSGSQMLFYNSAAPTGWVKQTSLDNRALRVVSGSGGGTGGQHGFTSVFANQNVGISISDSDGGTTDGSGGMNVSLGSSDYSGNLAFSGATNLHTLSSGQLPSHSHNFHRTRYATAAGGGGTPGAEVGTMNSGAWSETNTQNHGSGQSHNHTYQWLGANHNHTLGQINLPDHTHDFDVSFSGSGNTTLDLRVHYMDVILCAKS